MEKIVCYCRLKMDVQMVLRWFGNEGIVIHAFFALVVAWWKQSWIKRSTQILQYLTVNNGTKCCCNHPFCIVSINSPWLNNNDNNIPLSGQNCNIETWCSLQTIMLCNGSLILKQKQWNRFHIIHRRKKWPRCVWTEAAYCCEPPDLQNEAGLECCKWLHHMGAH